MGDLAARRKKGGAVGVSPGWHDETTGRSLLLGVTIRPFIQKNTDRKKPFGGSQILSERLFVAEGLSRRGGLQRHDRQAEETG